MAKQMGPNVPENTGTVAPQAPEGGLPQSVRDELAKARIFLTKQEAIAARDPGGNYANGIPTVVYKGRTFFGSGPSKSRMAGDLFIALGAKLSYTDAPAKKGRRNKTAVEGLEL